MFCCLLACGGVIFDEGVELMSPGFPQKYGPDIECEWEIRSLPGTHIGLVFTDRFYLQESVGCVNDFIKVSHRLPNDPLVIGNVYPFEAPGSLHSVTY